MNSFCENPFRWLSSSIRPDSRSPISNSNSALFFQTPEKKSPLSHTFLNKSELITPNKTLKPKEESQKEISLLSSYSLTVFDEEGNKIVKMCQLKILNPFELSIDFDTFKKIKHPYLEKIYKISIKEDLIHIFHEPRPISPMIIKKKTQEFESRIYIAKILLAINYLHNTVGCAHGNINSKNVLLLNSGSVLLLNYCEIPKSYCDDKFISAPELIIPKKKITTKIDIWNLGVFIYEILAGYSPFLSINRVINEGLILYNDLNFPNDFPEDGKTLIKKMMNEDPEQRPDIHSVIRDDFFKNINFKELIETTKKPFQNKIAFKINSTPNGNLKNRRNIKNNTLPPKVSENFIK